ncbi:MAG: BolA family protein [Kiloniellales bacterium]|nr:BolA family protein [Kiloniellales bacterium]
MTVAETIAAKLTAAFQPERLEVLDESHKHEGHGGWREGGETHFHVTLVAEAFAGRSRLERQRAVYAALAEELAGPVHALQVTARAPGEEGV